MRIRDSATVCLMMNRMVQTWVNRKPSSQNGTMSVTSDRFAASFPKNRGANTRLGRRYRRQIFQNNLGFNVDAVELDDVSPKLRGEYFALSNKVNIVVDDARHYLEETQKQYDVILFDVYRGELPPPHVFTLESLTKAKSLLKENGLIVVNFNGFLEGKTGRAARSIYKTLLAAGLETRILPTPGAEGNRNLLFVASRKRQDFSNVRSPLMLNGKQADIETLFLDPRN